MVRILSTATVHALVELLALFNCRSYFVSPASLRMPEEISSHVRQQGARVEETEDLRKAAVESDVIYMTRIQRERFPDLAEYEKVKGSYIIDAAFLKNLGKDVTILHPLPRVNEINSDVDNYPGAAYFRQMRNGVFIRMALIAMVMGKK
jgi:aspartate carbamoyltransferase catalytic subunit